MTEHEHLHGPHHRHSFETASLNKAFLLGIALNAGFVAAEFAAGFWYNSLGLISDAGHNLGDVASLILALLAFRLSKIQSNRHYTYGYKKSTVLVSLLNAVILLIAVGFILTESTEKLFHPQPLDGNAVSAVAGIGVIINGLTAWLFLKNKEKDLNVKGAYLHMAADTLVSVGVLVSGLAIRYTGWYVIDPLLGISIGIIIVFSTWSLLRGSIRLSLDGVPVHIDCQQIGSLILSTAGVASFHHLHIWALSTTETALTAHIVILRPEETEQVKCELKKRLDEAGITHATLEFEPPGHSCPQTDCRC